ncbi:hypothetical protein OWR29_00035 [Actinoplanes sp. Pm04-4]|uniref:Uncharacterized protein n=1 Tax=Paractinoplanes pyxinae TaxID=2997416 RepID=A0ABT4AQ42_9ACTN|nr:hypothetical protein [Actinoplanes pyxinae]MCY1136368.1 hypothetical protein [Actinoplanes pyxinae]
MTDDHGRLRRAMADLAEHGGNADMYARTLRKSRQSQRRTRIAATATAAAAVFTIAGAVAYATADRSAPTPPIATYSPTSSPTPTPTPPPTPTHTPSPSLTSTSTAPSHTPTSRPPRSSTTTSSPPQSSTTTSNPPRYPDCPSAKTLEKLVDLPEDWSFVPSSVKCWQTWATAAPQGPTPGDGIYLFRYEPGPGWRYHSQGSSYRCQDLGITEGDPPFCEMD